MGRPEARFSRAKKQMSHMFPGYKVGHTQDRYLHSKGEKLEKRKGARCQAHSNPEESATCSVACLQSHHLGDQTSYSCEFQDILDHASNRQTETPTETPIARQALLYLLHREGSGKMVHEEWPEYDIRCLPLLPSALLP